MCFIDTPGIWWNIRVPYTFSPSDSEADFRFPRLTSEMARVASRCVLGAGRLAILSKECLHRAMPSLV